MSISEISPPDPGSKAETTDSSTSVVEEEPPPGNILGSSKPWLTWLVCAASVAIFLAISAQGEATSWEAYSAWGAPPPYEIWRGKYWALITSVFVHVGWWHVAFNVYWLWILGGLLERISGHLRWLVFFITAAVISSGVELAFTGAQGVGLSGVVYAVFGLLLALRGGTPAVAAVGTPRIIRLFLGWLVLCVLLTIFKVFEVGNAAHVSGLAFGGCVGFSQLTGRKRVWGRTATVGLALLAVVPLFWSPWSGSRWAYLGYAAHARADDRTAIEHYERARRLGFNPGWLLQNHALAYASSCESDRYAPDVAEVARIHGHTANERESTRV